MYILSSTYYLLLSSPPLLLSLSLVSFWDCFPYFLPSHIILLDLTFHSIPFHSIPPLSTPHTHYLLRKFGKMDSKKRVLGDG